MKEVIAIVRINMMNQTKQALTDCGVDAFFAHEAHGRGKGFVNPKVLEGADVAAALDAFHVAVARDPLGRAAIHADPLREVFAIEENDGVGRRLAGLLLRAGGRRRDHGRQGPVAVVIQPVWIRLCQAGHAAGQLQREQGKDPGGPGGGSRFLGSHINSVELCDGAEPSSSIRTEKHCFRNQRFQADGLPHAR